MRDITVKIRFANLLDGVRGTAFKVNDKFCVVIDSKLSEDEQAAVFLHEMLHVWHDDASKDCSLARIERERAAELPRILSAMERLEQP